MITHGDMSLVSVPQKYWAGVVFFEVMDTHVYDRYCPLRSGMTVVDVGASIGIFSLYASKLVGSTGRVISFEPEPTSFNALNENLRANDVRNVTLYNNAVSDKNGTAKLGLQGLLYNTSLYAQNPESTLEVQTVTLDSALIGVEHIDLLKIDTEGGAMEILRGAQKVLQSTDNLAIELHPNMGEDPQQMSRFLQAQGFRTKTSYHYGWVPYMYATRDPNVILPAVDLWQMLVVAGFTGLLAYQVMK